MTVSEERIGRTGTDMALAEWIEELAGRLLAGEPVDLEACAREHPEWAERLGRLLPAIEMMADLGHSADRDGTRGAPGDPGAVAGPGDLGDFRILREVGRGGMGVVYEARQLSLNRRVALKILPFAATADPRQLQRFQLEAQAAACLHHNHIVPVHAVGCERGVPFYAMQFIDGCNLATVIAELRQLEGLDPARTPTDPALSAATAALVGGRPGGRACVPVDPDATASHGGSPLSPVEVETPVTGAAEATAAAPPSSGAAPRSGSSTRSRDYIRNVARMGVQVAEALDHAHTRGILHRDIKPANLLLDAQGQLWVTDFGLAQIQGLPGLTLTGDVLGTLRYMSPEQALARRVVVDGRTDIYSLGVTLYELLTLRPAVDGKDRAEILRSIAGKEPTLPRKLNPAVPRDLETILLTAMAKEPSERYPTASELAADLDRFLEDRPIAARRPSRHEVVWRWCRRNPAVASLLSLLAVLLVAGSVGSGWAAYHFNQLARRERSARGVAQAAQGRADRNAREAGQARADAERRAAETKDVVDFLVVDLIGAASPARKQGRVVTIDDVLARADKAVEGKFRGQPLAEAAIRLTLGQVFDDLGQYEAAERHIARARALREEQLGPEHPDTLTALNRYGWALYRRQRGGEARRIYERSLTACRRVFGPGHDETLAAMNGLASALTLEGRNREAIALQEERIGLLRKSKGPAHHDTQAAISDLAAVLQTQGKLAEAERLFRQDLDALRRDYPSDPVTLNATSDLIGVLFAEGKHEEAASLGKTNMADCLRVLGFQHPMTQAAAAGLTMSLEELKRYEEGRALAAETLERSRHELGPEAPFTRQMTNRLADILVRLGRLVEVEALLRQKVEALERARGPGDVEVLNTMNRWALVLRELGRPAEAREVFGRVVERARQELSPERRGGPLGPLGARRIEVNRAMAEVMARGRDRSGQADKPPGDSPAPPVIEAPFRTVAPVADGRVGIGEYGTPFEVTFTDERNPGILYLLWRPGETLAKTKDPDDLSVRLSAAHTATALFLAFEVRDQYVRAEESDARSSWFNDSIELFIDGDQVANDYTPITTGRVGNREGFQLVADALGHRLTIATDFTDKDWKVGTGRTDRGYVIEFEIPLRLIDTQDGPDVRPAATGSTLFLNAGVNDNDTALSRQSYYGMLWSEHPLVSPPLGGEDFWPVRLRLSP